MSTPTVLPLVALLGNPNCGKTTLFNALTGSRYKVANYPGVTIEKREGLLQLDDSHACRLLDLPGTYSIQGLSEDEKIVERVLTSDTSEHPDLIVAVVDATNLERTLFLVSELLESDIPIIVAVNLIDEAKDREIEVYYDLLSRELDLPIVPISAKKQVGLADLKITIQKMLAEPRFSKLKGTSQKSLSGTYETNEDRIVQIASERFSKIQACIKLCTKRPTTEKNSILRRIDTLLTNKFSGLFFLFLIFGTIFQSIFLWAQYPMELIGSSVDGISQFTKNSLPEGILTNLFSEGIIPGVGNVIIFVPQIALLFFFLGLLEDSGYLSRAAFLLDSVMRKVGLQGRAFIPLLSSFACAIPGILSTRTIPSKSERLATIMIAPLMSCSARLPVYAVLIAAFIPSTLFAGVFSLQGTVLLFLYVLGIVSAAFVAWIFKLFRNKREVSLFIVEIPPLRRPSIRVILRTTLDNVLSFLKSASSIILACSVVVWVLASYPKPEPGYEGNSVKVSYAGQLGTFIEPAIKPLGFNWEIGFAILSSFPAREVFITALATVYNVSDDDAHSNLIENLKEKNSDGSFTLLTALTLMVFYVFACQCMSTLAVCRRETGSWGWTATMFIYMTVLAYGAAYATRIIGSYFLG